ncbi:MAG: hypothetical protein OEM82_05465 [Acidobacteriota bacterium]|nr:hypothetical protein [Acidobacteriota bacterium]MDH3529020.1 hypothetical protein [Acidobacteriota bacterium]
MKTKSSLLILILLFATSVFAQEVPERETKAEAAELRAKALEFLRDTAAEINTLRTVENRISFSSELANLMWFHDEKEARKMFAGVSDSFVQLLTEANARVDALGGIRDETDRFGGFSFVRDEKREAIRKLYKAIAVREQVVLAIAEHDAQLGYDFVVRTTAAITDKKLSEMLTEQNARLESGIIARMSSRNLEESLAFGRRSLKRGFKPELVGLAQKVYAKDPEAAIEFGKELIDKVRSEASTEETSHSNIYSVLSAGTEMTEDSESGSKPLFAKEALNELAVLFAENLLRAEDYYSYMIDDYVALIEKYSPSHAKRVAAKYSDKNEVDDPAGVLAAAAEAAADAAKKAADMTVQDNPSAVEAAEQEKEEERQKFLEELQGFGSNELSKEQKSEFIAQARRILSEMKDPTVKIAALTMLARQVKMLGDTELAAEIMREANAMVKPDPQNFLDYMLVWSLASGYAEVAPEEAFPVLENAIYRLNDTIDAAVKVAQFVDIQGEIIIDGEVQVGAFGGSMIRNALGMLSQSGNVLASLAEKDFERTKALALSFEKPEVRVLARFMVLRSVLVKPETQELGLVKLSG